MTDKPFKTIAEQLDILRSRNLSISNPVLTSSLLSAYGYYEIINGYKSPFLTNPNSKEIDHYGDEIDFLNVFSLFRFDMELREQVLGIIELFESTLRQRVAYIFSKNHTEDQKELFNDKVLKPGKRNYDKQGHFVNYERDGFYHKLNKIINDDVDPFVHYREKHGMFHLG